MSERTTLSISKSTLERFKKAGRKGQSDDEFLNYLLEFFEGFVECPVCHQRVKLLVTHQQSGDRRLIVYECPNRCGYGYHEPES